ncbi:serine hydrolase [Streptomyces carpinensis]|uniref:Serine hydrolase n=1 Tax=Streptomyces carpinensis TaxID=66369 RepID=A0ABV1W1U9_9ACTN|nr:serine hydrolase [Streptomyces carpinensis]
MGQQVFAHRVTSGSPDGMRVAGKTGTLPGLHNEAAVVHHPDGGATRSRSSSATSITTPTGRRWTRRSATPLTRHCTGSAPLAAAPHPS